MERETIVYLANRGICRVGYQIPELGIKRYFSPRESKPITFGELLSLSYTPGGLELLREYLIIRDEEAIKEILGDVQPEYYYSEAEVEKLLLKGSLDEFLDCLDFAPTGVIEMVKNLAVDLEINDNSKREAILNKLGFNVSKAISVKNTQFDGETQVQEHTENPQTAVNAAAAPQRRVATKSKYKVIE